MALVGIDLGTTNSLVSVFTDDGPQLIRNSSGTFLTPSVVGISNDGDVLVGDAAKHRLITHPDKTVARFKRAMGTAKTHSLGKKHYKAEDLSALVLRSLKDDAEAHLGETVAPMVCRPRKMKTHSSSSISAAGHLTSRFWKSLTA